MRRTLGALVIVFAGLARAQADAALLLEEPFGKFGSINSTGHAAVYLSRICAASLTQLRRCEPGEAGVVVSRYHKIGGFDWLAIPLLPYLYAVDSVQQIPVVADAESVAALRDAYRRTHLLAIAPSDSKGRAPDGEWDQLVGSAYDRKIYGFLIPTTAEQDDAFIRHFNHLGNTGHFNLLFHNCADFSRNVLNLYYPHALHRSFIADVGITTPKQDAKSLVSYCRRNPEVSCSSFVIPQIAGRLPRSRSVHGVLEALLKTKKYVLPLAVLHPAVTGGLATVYLLEGRFDPKRNAVTFDVARPVQPPVEGTAAALAANFVSVNGAGRR